MLKDYTVSETYVEKEVKVVSYLVRANNEKEALKKFENEEYWQRFNKLEEDIIDSDSYVTDIKVEETND